MPDMDARRFQDIAQHFLNYERSQHEYRREREKKLYNTPANSHQPLAFVSFEDALAYQRLTKSIDALENRKRIVSRRAYREGFPVGLWIKVEGPTSPDDDATGIILRSKQNANHDLQTEDWTLVLAEG